MGVSQGEKGRLADAAKAAAKKLKAQQKQSLGKVASKASKKVARMSAGKKVVKGASAGKKAVKGASAGKKISAKKSALSAKKPVAKAVGKKGAAVGAKKKVAPKSSKAKSGK